MLSDLICSACGWFTGPDAGAWRCPVCGGPVELAQGVMPFRRADVNPGERSIWRYRAALPTLAGPPVSLGEGWTPLVPAKVGGVALLCKMDGQNPTGSYKDRGASVLLSVLTELGATHAVEDSSGNAAAAISAYAARARIACTVFAPAAASPAKLVQSAAFGATVVRVDGSRDDVAQAAVDAAAATPGATYASHNWQPWFIEGIKTWALEVWEQLGFRAPDSVIVPVGAGSMLLGAERAFQSLLASGEIDRMPRLFGAQAAGCAPLVAAIAQGSEQIPAIDRSPTIAEGIVIPKPIRGASLIAAIRNSSGSAVSVDEGEIGAALLELARQGLYVEPTSAVAAAAAKKLIANGTIRSDETTVLMLSGNGLKASGAIADLLPS